MNEMRAVMRNWLSVSLQLHESEESLLLHLPILLAYNHPTNVVLTQKLVSYDELVVDFASAARVGGTTLSASSHRGELPGNFHYRNIQSF